MDRQSADADAFAGIGGEIPTSASVKRVEPRRGGQTKEASWPRSAELTFDAPKPASTSIPRGHPRWDSIQQDLEGQGARHRIDGRRRREQGR